MMPQAPQRKKRNSSKVNLFISLTFHTLIVLALIYVAAREGFLGKHIQKISVQMIKEKHPPKPKPPEKPKVQPPKIVEKPKPVAQPKVAAAPKTTPPPPSQPTVAPPPAELPSFAFSGGRTVQSSSDPVQLYKGLLEYAFRSKWDRPQNMHDDKFLAEVRVKVGRHGRISDPVWLKSSGNKRWDNSVRQAIAKVTKMDSTPPSNFPPDVIVRFDVQQETEPVLQ